MWVAREERKCIWVDITAHEQSFVISVLGHGTGVVIKEPHSIPKETYANLQKTLNELTDPQRAPKREALHDFGALLFELVLPEKVQAYLLAHDGPVVFSTQELTLPWELLVVDSDFLCLKLPISRQFSVLQRVKHELFAAERFAHDPAGCHSALVIANCTGDLPAAAREAEEVGSLLAAQGISVNMLVGPHACTYQNILANHIRKRAYDIIHFSGHAKLQADTSGIPLPDGGMLMAQDIQRTFKGEPLVFLNACWSAKDEQGGQKGNVQSPFVGTRIVRTLAEAFSLGNRAGQVRAIVGSLWWIADDVAHGMASRFYTELFKGQTLGNALKNARTQVASQVDIDPALWGTYALFGEANLCLASSGAKAATNPAPAGDHTTSANLATARQDASLIPIPNGNSSEKSSPMHAIDARSNRVDTATTIDNSQSNALSLGLPWSDDIRIALAGGMAVMASMNWNVFSTIQLVLGLTFIKDGIVTQAINASGTSPAFARQAVMKIGSAHEAMVDMDLPALSMNLQRILRHSGELAQEQLAAEVGEAHVIAALLECKGAGGAGLLACLSVDLAQLKLRAQAALAKSTTSLTAPSQSAPAISDAPETKDKALLLPDGNLDRSSFDDDALAGFEEAILMAYRSYWPELRSPHLFLGILNRRGSHLARHMEGNLRLNAQAYATSILIALAQSQRPDASLRPPKLHREFFSENALGVLRSAHQLAQRTSRARISERALLEAILQDNSNFITTILKQSSIQPLSLLWREDNQ